MNPFSILMFIFSGALLLYAGLLALTKDYALIPRGDAVAPRDKAAYVRAFAKAIAVAALAPMSAGFIALFSPALGGIMLVSNFASCIWIGTLFFRDL